MSFLGEAVSGSAESVVSTTGLLDAKFRAAYDIGYAFLGGASPAGLSAVLYGALYAPEWTAATFADYIGDDVDMHAAVSTPIHREFGSIPDPQEFDTRIRDAITRSIDHRACLYPSSQDVILAMATKGPTAFWTQGDMSGDGLMPGSYEQIKKIAGAGAAEIRTRALLARAALVLNSDEKVLPRLSLARNDALTVVAAEDKFSDDSISRLVSFFEPQGVSRLVILEDRLPNLERIQDEMRGYGFDTCGIWVQQGKYNSGRSSSAELNGRSEHRASMAAVSEIGQVLGFIDTEPYGTGFICDFDGVFSDGERRLQLQSAAVRAMLTENNWL